MSRADQRLALESLEAADADTVRGSTLISQTEPVAIMCNAVQSPEKPFGVGWLPIPGRTASKQFCAGWLPFRVARHLESSERASPEARRALWKERLVAFTVFQSAGPEARAASHRALWRERPVVFTVFGRVLAPKRARHPTDHSGQTV